MAPRSLNTDSATQGQPARVRLLLWPHWVAWPAWLSHWYW